MGKPLRNRWQLGYATGGPTDEECEIILNEIAKGYSISGAAAAAERAYSTVDSWRTRGKMLLRRWEQGEELTDGQYRMAAFSEQIEIAIAKRSRTLEDRAHERGEKGSTTWNEPMTKLERLHKLEFAKVSDQGTGVTIVLQGQLGRPEGWGTINGTARVDEGLPAAPSPRGLPRESGQG